jgi:TRAP-type uncharacterized transport system fused permease subunit
MNPVVFFGSAVLTIAFVIFGGLFTESAAAFFQATQSGASRFFGWWYVLVATGLLVLTLSLLCTPARGIRLGGPDATPEFSVAGWFAMLFAAGMGVGLVYFGVAEPVMHLGNPLMAEPNTDAAAREAMRLSFYHWSLHACPLGALNFCLFVFADLEAGRLGIDRVPEARIPSLSAVARRGWFVFAPFAVLIFCLFSLDLRPETSALIAIVVLFGLSLIRTYDGRRVSPAVIGQVLVSAGRAAVEIVLICAIACMIIGLVARSGLSFGLGFFLVQLGQSSLPLLLGVTAAVCVVMGMGLPTVGVYLLLASLAAPPLVELGLQPMAAHLFVLYFGMLSMLSPPVAIASFVAANMAKAPPMETGFEAVRIAWPAYLIPFLFAASPALLLDGEPPAVAMTVVTAAIGVYFVTAAIVGYQRGPLTPWWRIMAGAGGVAVLLPNGAMEQVVVINLVGLLTVATVGARHWRRETRGADTA